MVFVSRRRINPPEALQYMIPRFREEGKCSGRWSLHFAAQSRDLAYGVRLHVWGEYACFTRPEMKVERVSYDAMTPSAARGILEAIHWWPAIRWLVDRIHVLKPIRFENLPRNELGA